LLVCKILEKNILREPPFSDFFLKNRKKEARALFYFAAEGGEMLHAPSKSVAQTAGFRRFAKIFLPP
jgi:hypothetical protein